MEDYKGQRKSELEKIIASMNELQDMGIIKYSVEKNETFNIQYNPQFILGILEYLSAIPLPLHIYKDVERNYKKPNERIAILSAHLARYGVWFNEVDRSMLELISPDSLSSYDNDRRVRLFSLLIEKFYDFDNPITKPLAPGYCWFRVRDGVLEEFKKV